MAFWLILLVTALTHISFKGSKVLMSLFAIELGASPALIGMLFAMYSLLPVFLSVYAGKISDRLGFRAPMILGACGLAAGLVLPYFFPSLAAMFCAVTLMGMCYIFFVVAVQHLIGSFGEGAERTRSYSLFSVTVGLTSLLGPTTAGFCIDGIGYRPTYLVLAALPVVPVLVLSLMGRYLPRAERHGERRVAERRPANLFGNAPLRRVLITAGIMETGNELVNFLLPIYGHSVGLTASQIGIVMGAYAMALLGVRAAMPALVRMSSEERVLSGSLFVAASVCIAFPFAGTFWAMFAMAFLLGLGLGSGGPLSMVLSYNRSPAGRAGEAIGLRQTLNKIAEVVMPLVYGWISTALGMFPVFWLGATLLGSAGWLMLDDARRIQGQKKEDGAGITP
jgi:MFS family permease